MTKVKIREVIVVEGRYDKNALAQVVDALIFETGGFSVFHSPEKLRALRTLAEKRGLIILTDSDSAGFLIRNKLKKLLPPEKIRQAFVPAREGKEKRKTKPSRQGLLGVEGMRPEVLLEALRRAGATELSSENTPASDASEKTALFLTGELSTADFYEMGLTGHPGSAELRKKLAESLDLPAGISQNDLRKAASFLLTGEELRELLRSFANGE